MIEPVANRILTELGEKLDAITVSAGAQIDARAEPADVAGNATDAVHEILYEIEELGEHGDGDGAMEAPQGHDAWQMVIGLYCTASTGDQSADAREASKHLVRVHAAVRRALFSDMNHTLGEQVIHLAMGRALFGEYLSLPAVRIPLTVVFHTLRDDPYQQ